MPDSDKTPSPQETREIIGKALKELEVNKGYLQKACEGTADLYFMRFQALKKSGFDAQEAMLIVTQRGLD